MLYRIFLLSLIATSAFGVEHVYLKTPDISRENIIGTNVGVRPFRKTGIRIEADTLQNKLLVHNYGYGGSGLTLSFGGAKEVADIIAAKNPSTKTVAVLGAGVAGLATSYELLSQGYEVHLYADKWSPNLTSDVAAGIWTPMDPSSDFSEATDNLHNRMLAVAKERFSKSLGGQPEFAGIQMMDYYSFKKGSSEGALKAKHVGEDVIAHFDNGITKTGRKIQKIAIDGKLYLADLFAKVQDKGALLQQRHFETLQEIASLEEPIIVNCLSLGSRTLFNDQDLIPVRGELIYYKPQEGIDYLMYENVADNTDYWVSIYPWSDRIILGGVKEYHQEALNTDPAILNAIIDNAEKCLSEGL